MDRDSLIERYFSMGINYMEILAFLVMYHGICLSMRQLRADVCKYQPEVCNSEKFKILKKIHNIAHGKLLQEIHVLLRSDNYF